MDFVQLEPGIYRPVTMPPLPEEDGAAGSPAQRPRGRCPRRWRRRPVDGGGGLMAVEKRDHLPLRGHRRPGVVGDPAGRLPAGRGPSAREGRAGLDPAGHHRGARGERGGAVAIPVIVLDGCGHRCGSNALNLVGIRPAARLFMPRVRSETKHAIGRRRPFPEVSGQKLAKSLAEKAAVIARKMLEDPDLRVRASDGSRPNPDGLHDESLDIESALGYEEVEVGCFHCAGMCAVQGRPRPGRRRMLRRRGRTRSRCAGGVRVLADDAASSAPMAPAAPRAESPAVRRSRRVLEESPEVELLEMAVGRALGRRALSSSPAAGWRSSA